MARRAHASTPHSRQGRLFIDCLFHISNFASVFVVALETKKKPGLAPAPS
jgi:hypothetical protein